MPLGGSPEEGRPQQNCEPEVGKGGVEGDVRQGHGVYKLQTVTEDTGVQPDAQRLTEEEEASLR